MQARGAIDIAFHRLAFKGLGKHWRSVASPRLMQQFGDLPSSTTLAIQVTSTTTVMIRRVLAMSCSLKKNRRATVPCLVRPLTCS